MNTVKCWGATANEQGENHFCMTMYNRSPIHFTWRSWLTSQALEDCQERRTQRNIILLPKIRETRIILILSERAFVCGVDERSGNVSSKIIWIAMISAVVSRNYDDVSKISCWFFYPSLIHYHTAKFGDVWIKNSEDKGSVNYLLLANVPFNWQG